MSQDNNQTEDTLLATAIVNLTKSKYSIDVPRSIKTSDDFHSWIHGDDNAQSNSITGDNNINHIDK